MWCYIEEENFSKFIETYPVLEQYASDIILKKINNMLFLPRLFLKNYPSPYLKEYKGKQDLTPEKLNIRSYIELRPKQKPIVQTVLDTYKRKGHVNGIIKAMPGIGKTVMSIHIACQLNLKTAIIIDNTELMEQWKEEILDKTDAIDEDIGFVKGNKFDSGKPFLIMSVQTLFRRVENDLNNFYEKIRRENIGLVFFDEVHSVSATHKYAKSSLLFQTLNIIGLSATPYHTGIQEILMKNTVGEIIYETKQYDLKPTYYFLKYDSEIDKNTKALKKLYFTSEFIHKKTIYDKNIVACPMYLYVIRQVTEKLLKQNHTVMILCMTIEQVKTISAYLSEYNIENRKFYGKEREIDKETDRVIVATYKFCGKGFNFKRLSALILATPLFGKKSLIQTTGRILREMEGKDQAIVVDLYDLNMERFFGKELFHAKRGIIKNEFNCKVFSHYITDL